MWKLVSSFQKEDMVDRAEIWLHETAVLLKKHARTCTRRHNERLKSLVEQHKKGKYTLPELLERIVSTPLREATDSS